MAASSTIVSLSQLVDLALNCPELGSINFTILSCLLQVLLLQVKQQEVSLEFHGEDSVRLQNLIFAARPTTAATFTDYTILSGAVPAEVPLKKKRSKEKKNVSLQDIKEADNTEATKEKEIKVIERRKDSREEPSLNPPPLASAPTSAMVVVDSSSKVPQFSVVISKHHFEELERDIVTLKEQIKELKDLPGNLGLIEATRSQDGNGPILDMFQILNLTKRMDAVEEGLQKMASIVEDVAKEGSELGSQKSKLSEILDQTQELKQPAAEQQKTRANLEFRVSKLEHQVKNLKMIRPAAPAKKKIETIQEGKEDPGGDQKPPVEKSVSAEAAAQAGGEVVVEEPDTKVMRDVIPTLLDGANLSELPVDEAMRLIQDELNILREAMQNEELYQELSDEMKRLKQIITSGEDGSNLPPEMAVNVLEAKFTDCVTQLNNMDEIYNSQMHSVQEQISSIQQELAELLNKINTVLPAGDSAEVEGENTMELYSKIVNLEKELGSVMDTAAKLEADKEVRDKNIDTIFEQIDLLKIIKANREDLEDALGDKADACMINRKVSHDQFDAACEDLTRGIEDALNKLTQQEQMWQLALESLHREMGNKLDKMEVDPLRDFVNSKLKALQDKFKTLTQLKREQEAAGTKSKFLRNVNCISCDKDVVMRKEMDVTLKPQPFALPPTKNIAPYLAYELDQLRKQQKCVPNSKNLNFFENALKNKGVKDKDHICNRYCGGSHTTTTPQQRVTRLGHFLEQWGPEIAPLQDEYIRGKDNHMYKARDDELLAKMMQEDMAARQSKGGRASSQAGGDGSLSKTKKDEIATKDSETPMVARNTMVDPEAKDLITDQAAKPRPATSGEIEPAVLTKSSSVELEVVPEQDQPRSSMKPEVRKPSAAPAEESRKASVRKASLEGHEIKKPSVIERRASDTQERKSSVTERRASEDMAKKTSVSGGERRPSSEAAQERKPSGTAERKPSDAQQERKPSATANQERKASEAAQQEKRASVSSQERKTSGAQQERKPSGLGADRKPSDVAGEERKRSSTAEKKKSDAGPDARKSTDIEAKKSIGFQE